MVQGNAGPVVRHALGDDDVGVEALLLLLVENSIKFTEEGGINVRIGYRLESYGITSCPPGYRGRASFPGPPR